MRASQREYTSAPSSERKSESQLTQKSTFSESVTRSVLRDNSSRSNTLNLGLYVPVAMTYCPSLVVLILLLASGKSKSYSETHTLVLFPTHHVPHEACTDLNQPNLPIPTTPSLPSIPPLLRLTDFGFQPSSSILVGLSSSVDAVDFGGTAGGSERDDHDLVRGERKTREGRAMREGQWVRGRVLQKMLALLLVPQAKVARERSESEDENASSERGFAVAVV